MSNYTGIIIFIAVFTVLFLVPHAECASNLGSLVAKPILDKIEKDSPVIWEIESTGKYYVPKIGGIKVCKAENKLIVAFCLTKESDDKISSLYKKEFSSSKRKPMGFEIDVIDYDNVFSEKDLINVSCPGVSTYNEAYMADENNVHTLAVGDPSNLQPGILYIATFKYKKHNEVPQARFAVQVQLVGDLYALKVNFPERYEKYSLPVKIALDMWFEYLEKVTGLPSLGNTFFNIRKPEKSLFDEGTSDQGKYFFINYDRVIWDFKNGQTKDFEPYSCAFGSYGDLKISDSNEGKTENDSSNDISSTSSKDPSRSSKKPDLFVKSLELKKDKRSYYSDENISLIGKVKNVGKDVDKDIKKIHFKLYRFKGEKINGDLKVVGDENIKGENLPSGKTKEETFKFKAPGDEDKYQCYACVDTENVISESNEKNNCSDKITFRIHKRPNLKISDAVLTNGRSQFQPGEIPSLRVTITNDGGEPFADVKVQYYLDSQFIGDDNMRHWNIENGEVKHEEIWFPVPKEIGKHTITAHIDFPDNKNEDYLSKTIAFEVIETTVPPLLGDLNNDGKINILDNNPEIFALIQNGENQVYQETIMSNGDTFSAQVIIPTNQQTVIFMASWPGSDVDMSLISPGGKEINSSTIDLDLFHEKYFTYELYSIANPDAGTWNINLYGMDLSQEGELVSISVTTSAQTYTASEEGNSSTASSGSGESSTSSNSSSKGGSGESGCFINITGMESSSHYELTLIILSILSLAIFRLKLL